MHFAQHNYLINILEFSFASKSSHSLLNLLIVPCLKEQFKPLNKTVITFKENMNFLVDDGL